MAKTPLSVGHFECKNLIRLAVMSTLNFDIARKFSCLEFRSLLEVEMLL